MTIFSKNLEGGMALLAPCLSLCALRKKQVWHPMFEPEVFRKLMHCIK